MSTALITGVAGFLGRYCARHFFEQGWKVVGIDTANPENTPLSYLHGYYPLSLPSATLDQILAETMPDCLIHCAGRAAVPLSVTDPWSDYQAGPPLVFFVLDGLRRIAPECKFIFLSSAAVYGNPVSLPVKETDLLAPISPYGFHKWQSELVVSEFSKVYHLPAVSLRIFSAYGPGLRRQVIWDICRKLLTEPQVVLQGTGQETRDFIHAMDIARGVEVVVRQASLYGDVYNLSTGCQVTIHEIAHQLRSFLESDKEIIFNGQLPNGTPVCWQADITKINQLSFSARIDLFSGLKAFADWCKIDLIGVC